MITNMQTPSPMGSYISDKGICNVSGSPFIVLFLLDKRNATLHKCFVAIKHKCHRVRRSSNLLSTRLNSTRKYIKGNSRDPIKTKCTIASPFYHWLGRRYKATLFSAIQSRDGCDKPWCCSF